MATSDDQPKKYGVAFSGGGIRSAAFCSGVLRRLIRLRGVELNYLSCVSGGGYTGTAYLDWKYRNKGSDDEFFNNEFFNNMRSRSGYICNWQKPLHGLWDTAVLFFFTLFVIFCIPVIGWGSLACPLALFIDETFGKYLNATRYRCDESTKEACEFPMGSLARSRMWIFLATLAGFVIFYLLQKCIPKQDSSCSSCFDIIRDLLHFFEVLGGLLFAFTFLPWFINDYFENAPTCVEIGIVLLSGAVWFFFPILRRYSSLVILIYCYSYVIYWRVYEETLLTIQHTDQLFYTLLYISLIILGVASFIGDVPLIHIYNRWRLQKAFYTEESAGKNVCEGCAGISFYDCFPGSYCFTPAKVQENTNSQPLSLSHLKDIEPQYISNITVNNWRNDQDSKLNCRLLTISPKSIGVIDEQPQQQQQNNLEQNDVVVQIEPLHNTMFDNKLEPGDFKLSSAMAMSGAAMSPYMGKFVQKEQALTHIFTILGVEMAASIVFDLAGERNAGPCAKFSYWFVKIVFMGALIIFPILYFCDVIGDSVWYPGVVAVFFAFMAVLSICMRMSRVEILTTYSRWLRVHVPFFRFMWAIINVVTTGPEPPAMLHLSDGGHFENLGILPLFKLRLKKIVAVYGGGIKSDSCYAKELVYALELAREILNCSFTAMKGDDVLKDIEENFVKSDKEKKYHRKYEFKVHYYEGTGVERKKVGEGDVVFITPRDPKKGHKVDIEEEANSWAEEGWKVASSDVMLGCCECCGCSETRCTLGCCECCGCSETRCTIRGCAFPHHTTANQFFTPKMFSVYHKEGYRACMEANKFFGAQPDTKEGEESVEEERKGGRASKGKGKGGNKERAEIEGEEEKRRKGEARPEEAEEKAGGAEGRNERTVEKEWKTSEEGKVASTTTYGTIMYEPMPKNKRSQKKEEEEEKKIKNEKKKKGKSALII